jgi:hypothetical protein
MCVWKSTNRLDSNIMKILLILGYEPIVPIGREPELRVRVLIKSRF